MSLLRSVFFPRICFALTAFAVLTGSSSFADSDSEAYSAFRNQVLLRHVRDLLSVRADALGACWLSASPSERLEMQREVQNVRQGIRRLLRSSVSSESGAVVDAIELYRKSGELKACAKAIRAADSAIRMRERKRFSWVWGVAAASAARVPGLGFSSLPLRLMAQLDPYCSLGVQPERSGVLERNPCMAGDGLALSVLRGRGSKVIPTDTQRIFETFAIALYEKIQDLKTSARETSVDLWSLYLSTLSMEGEPDALTKREFLAVLALLSASNTSAAGYVDGFADFAWRSELSQGESATQAFAQYVRRKKVIDLFFTANREAREKNVVLRIGDEHSPPAYHHDVMASFLSCHFAQNAEADDRRFALAIPSTLGIAYETLDFRSHLKDRVGVKTSIRSFQTDTARYRTSARWGLEFCRSLTPQSPH